MRFIRTIFCLMIFFWLFSRPVQAIVNPLAVPNNRFGISLLELNDLPAAAALVNSQGGDWGYVTLVIPDTDRNVAKWQAVFNQLRRLHLIPLVRLVTHFDNGSWAKPAEADIGPWTEFLNSLNWVAINRYVILFNEPNHALEWGNDINPKEYVNIATKFTQSLKQASPDFFILPAGFDTAAPYSANTIPASEYWRQMYLADKHIFTLFDGWNSHSYPNPNFSGPVIASGFGTIASYKTELKWLARYQLPQNTPVFITETGWLNSLGDLSKRYSQAFTQVWVDPNLVAITPFVLNYLEPPFAAFSWKIPGSENFYPHYQTVSSLPKPAGRPQINHDAKLAVTNLPDQLISNSDYRFFLEFINLGQSIWNRQDFSLKVTINLESVNYLVGYLDTVEPNQKTKIDFDLKTPAALDPLNFSFQLMFKNQPFGDVFSKTVKIVPPPQLSFITKPLIKLPAANDDVRLLIYNSENDLLEQMNLTLGGNESGPIALYNLVPGAAYRLVLLKDYYLPRQAWFILNPDSNQVKFKPLLPFDPDRSGNFTLKDFWLLLNPAQNFRFLLQFSDQFLNFSR
ncbi:MAG: hypothetical protein AAB430_03605 [Patescibacteria group bacterium]